MDKKIYKPKPYKINKSSRRAKLITFSETNEKGIKINFPYNREDLDNVKSLPGRIYHSTEKEKFWTCPFLISTVKKLKEWGFELDSKLFQYLIKQKNRKLTLITSIPGLKKEPRPFQYQAVSFIEQNNGQALIADEMGLGKTIETISWLQMHPEKRPTIIVTPASVKINWSVEIQSWMESPKVQVLSGSDSSVTILGEIIVINYDILHAWTAKLLSINPQVLILDEGHFIKNNGAKRTKAVKKIAKNIPNKLVLTGTPIVNRPIEFYNILKLLKPTLFPNRWEFAHKYCDAKHNGFGWDFNGASNTAELYQILTSSIMIRRLKKDVLKELPDKTYSMVYMELENRDEYDLAERDFIEWIKNDVEDKLKEQLFQFMDEYGIDVYDFNTHKLDKLKQEKVSKINILTEIESLKQLAVKGKIKQVLNWVKDFLESGEKLVLFANHKFVIDILMKEFSKVAVKIDGSVPPAKRQHIVEEFQTNKYIRLFVGNIKAAGVGLTLTASSNVGIIEFPWTPGDLTQAVDRCHRISQKNAVNIYYFVALNTIEEKIAKLLDEKQKILSSVLDGKTTEKSSLLTELLNQYK